MGKSVKRRRRKQYMYNVDRHKTQQKRKKQLQPRIPCEAIRAAWDPQKHTKANLEAMGLAFKVNSVMPVPGRSEPAAAPSTSDEAPAAAAVRRRVRKPQVVPQLEADASRPREKRLRLPREQVRLVEHMMDRHGQNFVAMARDSRNHYQMTPKQIRRLVARYWEIPDHFTPYMKRKGMLEKMEVSGDGEE